MVRHFVIGIMVLVAWGCSEPRARGTGSEASTAAEPWYLRSTELDLTGDGLQDSVRLEAFGVRPDSLRIALVLTVGGEEKFREEWGSAYELALADSLETSRSGVDAFMRGRLDTVLASVKVEPLDGPSVRLMAEDSAILATLTLRPELRISISYGYESTVRLVWDAPRHRFVRLWSCC